MEDPGSQNMLWQALLLFILTLLNAFFSAAEKKAFNKVNINSNKACHNIF